MKYKDYLVEMKLSTQQALEILGMKSFTSDSDLKKAYKRASIKHHPDKGGTQEGQQLVNSAFKMLQSGGITSKETFSDWKAKGEERRKAQQEREELWKSFITQQFNDNFEKTLYDDFLKDAIGKELTREIYYLNTNINIQWTTDDRKIVFTLFLHFRETTGGGLADQTQGLKIGEVSYSTEVLINRKKVKMTQSNYIFGAKTKNIFKDPKASFPKTKIKKALGDSNKPLKKADYMLTFKNELTAKVSGNIIRLPIKAKDDHGTTCYIMIERTTFMRKGVYYIRAVYNNMGVPYRRSGISQSFYESPKGEVLELVINQFKKIVNAKTKEDAFKLIDEFATIREETLKESVEQPETFKSIINS